MTNASSFLCAAFFCSGLSTVSATSVIGLPSTTLTGTGGLIKVYEALSGINTYYYLDILNEASAAQVSAFAVSINVSNAAYGGIGGSLGPDNGSGVFNKSLWSNYSTIPFATLFGPTDNFFIYIKGTNPITVSNDIDGISGLTISNYHGFRSGQENSQYVAFNSSGAPIDASLTTVPEPSSALLGGLSALALLRRRRR